MATSVSSVTSHFPDTENGFTTTTAGSVSSGAATVTLNSVSGYTNGQPVVLVIDPTDASKKQTFTGIVDTAGVQITSVVWTAGTNQAHALGATVVDYATATHIAMISKGIQVEHSQSGTHTNITQADANFIKDTSGNELLKWSTTASAVNELTIKNAATGTDPRISASGTDANVNLNLRGKGLAKTVTIGAGAATIFPYDYVVSGCVWTADSAGVNRNASMTAGVVVINGNPITVAAVTARTFTASKDVYVDVLDNGDGTGLLVYTDGTTNAASGALAANSIRLAIIVVGATSIATAASINQGQEDRVLPIASSIPYAVTDSLGNLICPRDPQRRILGYRQKISNQTVSTSTTTQITELSVPFIAIANRKVRTTVVIPKLVSTVGFDDHHITIWDGAVGGTKLQDKEVAPNVSGNTGVSADAFVVTTPSTTGGLKTYNAGLSNENSGGSASILTAASTSPAYIMVELV